MDTDRHSAQSKEWFSHAFLIAVASVAGFPVAFTDGTKDIDGVDATVRAGGITVDFQLKATSSPHFDEDNLLFDLDVPTYNKLVTLDRNSPAYLLVITLPTERSDWAKLSDTELLLRHRSYWLKMTGKPDTTNTSRVRLRIPIVNALTAESLADIMQNARQRLPVNT